MDGAFVVCIFFNRKHYSCEADCFSGEPGDALEGEEFVRVIRNRFVLSRRGQLWCGVVWYGEEGSVCLHTMMNFPERFLIVTPGGAAMAAVLGLIEQLQCNGSQCAVRRSGE